MCLGDLTSASVLAAITRQPKKVLEKIIKCNDVFFNKQCKLQCVHLSSSYNWTINCFLNLVVWNIYELVYHIPSRMV